MGTRSRMCMEVGRCGYMWKLLFYIVSMLIWLSYYVCRNYMYTDVHIYLPFYTCAT